MIATPHFIHIHLHKSGGTFVNECLLRFFPDARQLGYHLPRTLIPAELGGLPVLGFVRNPWSYYVSWYAFQSQRRQPNALFRWASEDGRLDFNATVRNLLLLGDEDSRLDELLRRLPDAYTGQGINLPNFALAAIRGSGQGFYSFLFQYMYTGDDARLFVGRTESLRGDFLAFLERIGTPAAPTLRDFVENEAPRNTSVHGAFQNYYDEATTTLVAQRDRRLIEQFGFAFAA
jgi:hypothetical protein